MTAISMRQIEASYDIASQVYDQKISIEAGARLLRDTHGLNINSARDFINDYKLMLLGRVFQRAMSAPAIDYFLTRIYAEHGPTSLDHAISAVRLHIIYFEGIRDVTLHAMRAIVERHEAQRQTPTRFIDHQINFDTAVLKSFHDSASNRQTRLQEAAKVPLKVQVITDAYLRNADVVAEVLHRAAGKCERCTKAAPFMRKKNGTPYLEVHHKKHLAHGGEDTVANAIAVCPNCHRELHFGVKQ